MAGTPPRTGSPATHNTDLIIIGGGPAGCAAARMAASVGMPSILVEPDRLCRNLCRIPALNNVPGRCTSGPHGTSPDSAPTRSDCHGLHRCPSHPFVRRRLPPAQAFSSPAVSPGLRPPAA